MRMTAKSRPTRTEKYGSLVRTGQRHMDKAKFHIKRWDPSAMQPGRILVIVGARNTGKSVCQLDLLRYMKDKCLFGLGMCPTLTTTNAWRKIMPASWIHNEFDSQRLEAIVAAHHKRLQAGKTPPSIFLVMDDCSYDREVMKSKAMRQIVQNGRHMNIHLTFACQSLMDLPPWFRGNVDYLICTSDKIITNRMKLWKHNFGLFEKYEQFSATFDACTQSFSCCVLDNTVRSQNVSDCVFWWRADPAPGKFKMGTDLYRRLARQSERGMKERNVAQVSGTVASAPPALGENEEEEQPTRVEVTSRKKKPSDIVAIDDGSGQLVATTAETPVKVKEVVHEAPSIEVGDGFPPPPCTHPVIHVAAGDGLGFV